MQRDVLLENIYDEINGIKNIELILPLFKENLLLYTPVDTSGYTSFTAFSQGITTIGVTNKEAYSFRFFDRVCRLLNIHTSGFEIVEGSYQELADQMQQGNIDLIVSFSLPLQALEENKAFMKMGFSQDELQLVTQKITNVFPTTNISDIDGYTVGSWTFLVGLDTSRSTINDGQANGLSENLIDALENNTHPIARQIRTSVDYFTVKENHRLLTGIPLTSSLSDRLSYFSFKIRDYFSIGFIALFLLFAGFIFRKKLLVVDYLLLWVRYKHIIIGVLSIIGLYFLSVEALLLAEKEFYKDLGIKSRVLNLTRSDLHFWITVTNLTGNNNNIFPLSYMGQLMLSFSSYILIIGSLIVTFWEYIIYKLTKKRRKGTMEHKTTNHIVVIGWKDNTSQFLEEILHANKNFKKQSRKLICITQHPEERIEQSEVVKNLHDKHKIEFVAGDAREERVLKKANLHRANTVVILSEDTSKEADEKTLLRALAISRYCRKMTIHTEGENSDKRLQDVTLMQANKYEDSIYIIAELNDKKYSDDLKKSDVNEIVNGSEYSKNILTQSLLNHGVSKVLDEILTYNEYNEFYTIDLKEEKFKSLREKTFDELLPILRARGILLIAIRVVYHDTNEQEIIDEERLNALLLEDNLKRQIIVNPSDPVEKVRPVDSDDQLIVFCTNASVLMESF